MLNTPEVRQAELRQRLGRGEALVAAELAREFGISPDTVRRDLLALEAGGAARRTRGGVLPVSEPVAALPERLRRDRPPSTAIVRAALERIQDGMTLALDGGLTVLALARALPRLPRALVVTPCPAVASVALDARIEIVLIGGRLSPLGGIAVGGAAEAALSDVAADLCFLGACGLSAGHGLGADDLDEARVKRRMAEVSGVTVVLAGREKFERRSRHRVLPAEQIDVIVTDAPSEAGAPFRDAGVETRHV